MSPAATLWQYVNVPTWVWLGPAQWVALHATAAMPEPKPGLTSLVSPSPDCGWTWKHSAAGSPDQKLEVTAHIVYDLVWAVTGAPGGGTLPPLNSATSTYRLTVGEIEALNTK